MRLKISFFSGFLRPLPFHLSLFNVRSRYYKQDSEYPRKLLVSPSGLNLAEQLHTVKQGEATSIDIHNQLLLRAQCPHYRSFRAFLVYSSPAVVPKTRDAGEHQIFN